MTTYLMVLIMYFTGARFSELDVFFTFFVVFIRPCVHHLCPDLMKSFDKIETLIRQYKPCFVFSESLYIEQCISRNFLHAVFDCLNIGRRTHVL